MSRSHSRIIPSSMLEVVAEWIPGDEHNLVQLVRGTGPPESPEEIRADEKDLRVSPELRRLAGELQQPLELDHDDPMDPESVWEDATSPYRVYTADPNTGRPATAVLDRLPPDMDPTAIFDLTPREFRWLRRQVPDLGLYRWRNLLAMLLHHGLQEQADYLIRMGADLRLSWSHALDLSTRAIRPLLQLGVLDPSELVPGMVRHRVYQPLTALFEASWYRMWPQLDGKQLLEDARWLLDNFAVHPGVPSPPQQRPIAPNTPGLRGNDPGVIDVDSCLPLSSPYHDAVVDLDPLPDCDARACQAAMRPWMRRSDRTPLMMALDQDPSDGVCDAAVRALWLDYHAGLEVYPPRFCGLSHRVRSSPSTTPPPVSTSIPTASAASSLIEQEASPRYSLIPWLLTQPRASNAYAQLLLGEPTRRPFSVVDCCRDIHRGWQTTPRGLDAAGFDVLVPQAVATMEWMPAGAHGCLQVFTSGFAEAFPDTVGGGGANPESARGRRTPGAASSARSAQHRCNADQARLVARLTPHMHTLCLLLDAGHPINWELQAQLLRLAEMAAMTLEGLPSDHADGGGELDCVSSVPSSEQSCDPRNDAYGSQDDPHLCQRRVLISCAQELAAKLHACSPEGQMQIRQRVLTPAFKAVRDATGLSPTVASLFFRCNLPEFPMQLG